MKNIQHIWPCFTPITQVFSERMTPAEGQVFSRPPAATLPPLHLGTRGLAGPCQDPFASFLFKVTFPPLAGWVTQKSSHWAPPSFSTSLTASSFQVRAKECPIMANVPNSLKASSERPTYHKSLTGTSLSVYIINTVMVCVLLYSKFARFSFVTR